MKKSKFLIFLLCFCMLLPLLVSCGGEEKPDDLDDKYEYDDSSRENARDPSPEGYDLDNQTISI